MGKFLLQKFLVEGRSIIYLTPDQECCILKQDVGVKAVAASLSGGSSFELSRLFSGSDMARLYFEERSKGEMVRCLEHHTS